MENKFGKTSKLVIKAGVKNNQTVLQDVFFTAPFKIMHPFYHHENFMQHDDFMTIMCLTASAGIMAGDEQDYTILVQEGAKLEFVSQSYEKIHKMETGSAQRTANLYVAKDAFLYYNPFPTLPFKDSAFTSFLKVHLEDTSSKFILKEILSAGRCARGERFEYRYYHNQINVYESDTLIYADNTRLEPKHMALTSIGMYEHYTHLGTLLMFHISKDHTWFNAVRDLLETTPDLEGGVTITHHAAIIIRILGNQSEKINRIMDEILAL